MQNLVKPFYFSKGDFRPITYSNVKRNMYEINEIGQIRNIETGHYLSSYQMNNGYYTVSLRCQDNIGRHFLIHRLVAHEFIPNDDIINKTTVNHKSGIKSINCVENLEWVSQSENNKHARDNKLNDINGENSPLAKITNDQAHTICKMLSQKYSYKQILDYLGLDSSPGSNYYDIISNIKRGIAWKHISCQYNFDDSIYKWSNHSISEIKTICELLEQGKSIPEIYNLTHTDKYVYKNCKKFYEFVRLIKNRKQFIEISKDYNF